MNHVLKSVSIFALILATSCSSVTSGEREPASKASRLSELENACTAAGDNAATDFEAAEKTHPNYPAAIIQSGTPSEILNALSQFCGPGCMSQAPWIMMNSSRTDTVLGMGLVENYLAQKFLTRTKYTTHNVSAVLSAAGSAPAQYSPETATYVQSVIMAARNNTLSNKLDIQINRLQKYLKEVCINYLEPDCEGAVEEALKLSTVGTITYDIDGTTTTDLTVMDEIQQLFSDPRQVQGLAITAQTLQKRAQDVQNGLMSNSDFLSDIEAGYVKAGFDASTATDLAFIYLAYYGARGASVEFTTSLANHENYPVLVSSYVIAAAVGVLDAYTYPSGHPYSLPKTVSTHCKYGRPYHFWLSAYLARKIVLDKHSERSAMIATHVFGVGYEMAAGTVTRVPYLPLTISSDDPGNNSIRLNIAMDDAGGRFGAYSAKNKFPELNVDKRIHKLLKDHEDAKPLAVSKAEDLFTNHFVEFAARWALDFNPDEDFLALEIF